MHCIWGKSGSKKKPFEAVVENGGGGIYEGQEWRNVKRWDSRAQRQDKGRGLVVKSGDLGYSTSPSLSFLFQAEVLPTSQELKSDKCSGK